ncbi:MAG: HAD hydrolase-like protein [Oscillospiraceae bacterium]|jgi:phosphoglycolate phosphatase|nr:HAD hydrolase-like protein [Oscillospiraceae bacterium]
MPNYDAVIFDNDGTVLDAAPGILKSANAAFAELGYPVLTMEEFMPYLGPPLQDSFTRFAGMPLEEAERAIAVYRREYTAGNCFLLEVYPGMEDLLRKLRAAGAKTGIASSKPAVFLEKILSEIGLRPLFDAVCGTALDRLHDGKDDIIAEAARRCGAPVERCLMVGDRRFDVEGAHALGMPCVGALWGYGSREELEAAGADFLAAGCGEIGGICIPLPH